MSKRLVIVVMALGLVVGLLAGGLGGGTAGAATPPGSNVNWVFFPWVPNGETEGTTGPWYGSVTIQNIEDSRINIAFGPTAGGVNPSSTTTLEAHASKTFSASALGLSGTGGAVAVRATWWFDAQNGIFPSACAATTTQTQEKITRGSSGLSDPVATQNAVSVVGVYNSSQTLPTRNPSDYTQNVDFTYQNGTITWTGAASAPSAGSTYYVVFNVASCTRGPQIAGLEKQVAPGDKNFAAVSSSANLSEDGYSAIPDIDVAWGPASSFCNDVQGANGGCNNQGAYFMGFPVVSNAIHFDGMSYLPIVQANWSGWNTIIHLSNIDASSPSFAAVDIHFYNQDQGVFNTAVAVDSITLNQGASASIDVEKFLASQGITTPFVGSAWISSDYGVVATSSRVKDSTNMALTNTGAPSLFATTSLDSASLTAMGSTPYAPITGSSPFQMYAPLVYKDYNGWNTGINVANVSETENQVTVEIFNRDSVSVGSYTAAIPPKGMHYFYFPTTQDQGLGDGDFGAAIISGQLPFHASIDEVKYSTGEAMSYIATAANIIAPLSNPTVRGDVLSLPLFQKGNGSHGDTSGIDLFNPRSGSASGTVDFYLPSGALENSLGSVPFTIGPHGSALVYAPNMANMTPGATLSAVVHQTSGLGSVTAVSNNVNYDIKYDGGTAFNMFNQWGSFRYVCSQTDCGFLVQGPGGFVLVPPWAGGLPGPTTLNGATLTLAPAHQDVSVDNNATVTATLDDYQGHAIQGATINFSVTPGAGAVIDTPTTGSGTTDVNGQASFSFHDQHAGTTDSVVATVNGTTITSNVATVTWLPGAPATIVVNPPTGTAAVNTTGEQWTATVTDQFGNNVADGTTILWQVERPSGTLSTSANPATGSTTTTGGVTSPFSYTNPAAGTDTIRAYYDADSSGTFTTGDPNGTATFDWTPTLTLTPDAAVASPDANQPNTEIMPVGYTGSAYEVTVNGYGTSNPLPAGYNFQYRFSGTHGTGSGDEGPFLGAPTCTTYSCTYVGTHNPGPTTPGNDLWSVSLRDNTNTTMATSNNDTEVFYQLSVTTSPSGTGTNPIAVQVPNGSAGTATYVVTGFDPNNSAAALPSSTRLYVYGVNPANPIKNDPFTVSGSNYTVDESTQVRSNDSRTWHAFLDLNNNGTPDANEGPWPDITWTWS